jgi:hypothetical protein
MAKIQIIALNIITAALIAVKVADQIYAARYLIDYIIFGILFLGFAYVVVSIISIFRAHGMVKRRDEEKLKKSASVVKLGSIFFWIVVLVFIKLIDLWGIEKLIARGICYIVLLGTSIFSLAYIRLLFKEKKLNAGQTVLYTLSQLFFVIDIIGILILRHSVKNAGEKNYKKSVADFVRFFLGSYQPPLFVGILVNNIKQSPIPKIANNIVMFFPHQWKNHRVRFCLVLAVLCLIPAGFHVYNFLQSRKPQLISVSFRVQAPETTGNPQYRRPLTVSFMGSAATVEMTDNDVPSGMITINPPIEGNWRWKGDDTLIFATGQTWQVGKRYTVSFGAGLFPEHIKVDNSFNFETDNLTLRISESEFYIDPEDGSIKRALFTVQTNYPVDTASLESSITMEPQINAASGSIQKRPYQFAINYSDDKTSAYIISEPLGMPAKPIQMQLRIAEGVKDSGGSGRTTRRETASVEIPGITTFVQVYDLSHELIKNDQQLYDQVFIMTTQGTIAPDELAKNISAWVLPVDKPELPGLRAQKDYNWYDTDEMVPEVLDLARKLNIEALPNELQNSSVNSWKFSADPGRYIYVKLNEGAKFFGGYVLGEPYETIIRVKNFPRELEILSEGSILSFSGDKRLAIMSRGIKDVEFNIGRIRPDDINHLISQTSGDIKNINFRNYSFNQYNISEQYSEATTVPVASERDIGYFSFDFSRYLENIPDRNLRHGFLFLP